MLLYKAWRESRLGFLLSFGALVVFSAVYLSSEPRDPLHRYTYTQNLYLLAYRGALRNIFIMLTPLLGLGGLQRERANGTVLFTLSLPVSRFKLITVRALAGLIEMAILASVPAVVIPLFSTWKHQPYPSFAQAFHFSLLWMGCGTALFAFGILLSTFVPGDYPAAAACLISLFLYLLVLNLDVVSRIHLLDFFDVMSGAGMPYFGGRNLCTIAWIPWSVLAGYVLAATALFAMAWRVVEQQEF